jgi:hypothetical protein
MDQNSPKHLQTGMEEIAAIAVLRTWLDQVGGNQRIPQVLDVLAQRTVADLKSGHPTPGLDAETLRRLHSDTHGGRIPDSPASRWLSSTEVRRWWTERQFPLEQACRNAELALMPVLTLQAGGGRGNTTQYRLDFQTLSTNEELTEGLDNETNPDLSATIRYQTEPAKPSWWLGLLVGNAPFRMRSWRGYLLIGVMLAEAFAILALWALLALVLGNSRAIVASDLGLLLVVSAVTWTWWRLMTPLIRLPMERITIANQVLLGWSQLNGQLRLVRDSKSKVAGGWFQLVRHWGTCPICSGEVEITEGGHAFPGRVVGRCGDSPMEHVFSFDPVSLVGRSLR